MVPDKVAQQTNGSDSTICALTPGKGLLSSSRKSFSKSKQARQDIFMKKFRSKLHIYIVYLFIQFNISFTNKYFEKTYNSV